MAINSIRVGFVIKTDDEVHALSTIKIFLLLICFLHCAKKGRDVENIKIDVATLKIVTTMQKL